MVGMFYGARRYDLLGKIIWYGLKIGIFCTSFIGLLVFVFPQMFMRIFTPDKGLVYIGASCLMINVFTFPLMAVGIVVNRSLQGLGSGFLPFFLQVIRVFVVAVPLGYLFVYVFDLSYLFLALAAVMGSITSSFIGLIWLISKLRFLEEKQH